MIDELGEPMTNEFGLTEVMAGVGVGASTAIKTGSVVPQPGVELTAVTLSTLTAATSAVVRVTLTCVELE